jgi:hypothetical protein
MTIPDEKSKGFARKAVDNAGDTSQAPVYAIEKQKLVSRYVIQHSRSRKKSVMLHVGFCLFLSRES